MSALGKFMKPLSANSANPPFLGLKGKFQINNGAAEQLLGISQVNEAVTQLDGITQQNAAMVEQLASSAGSLQVQADTVAETVSVASNPVRNGLSPTEGIVTVDPGTSSAATRGNAADDGSAGTTTLAPLSSGCPVSEIFRP